MKKKIFKSGMDKKIFSILGYLFCGTIAVICLLPFLMVLSASVSSNEEVVRTGYSILPKHFTLSAYQSIFSNPTVVCQAYLVTIFLTSTGTFLGLFMTSMTAYVLARKDFPWRNKFSLFFYFTTLFSGGLVSTYILMIKYLNFKNTYLALLLPLLFNAFNLLIMKSYMISIPGDLIDASKIDGCGDFRTYLTVVLPMCKASFATVGLFIALAYWNDWYNAMLYIDDETMYPLQYFLYQRINNIEAYKRILSQSTSAVAGSLNLPVHTLKMALTIVITGPFIFAYPMVHKYFVKGVTIGAVKG